MVDPAKAESFKQRNKAAKIDHEREHDCHDISSGHSCGDVTKAYYLSESQMSSVDRAIKARIISETFFKQRLELILQRAHQASHSIATKARERGMLLDDDQIKELHAKAMIETVNRLIFQEVYAELK